MLSVLIPTYNYNIQDLVESIHQQLTIQNITFEIIVFEDGSTSHINSNAQLSCTKYINSKENIGRVKARAFLANQAKYNWLLFLDADVLPKENNLIENYLKTIDSDYDAVFGGFAYYKTKPGSECLLRWAYGKCKEQVPAVKRNTKPYKVIISANFLIKKAVFLDVVSSIIASKGYGYDTYFASILKYKNYKVFHIDNEVYHLGIEKSSLFLNKIEQSINTLLDLHQSSHENNTQNDLLKAFINIKRYQLTRLFSFIYSFFGRNIKKNLLGNSPSINLLQLYKISYMCAISKK